MDTTGPHTDRLSRARLAARAAGLAGLVIGTGADLAYLTGLTLATHERLTALVLPTRDAPTALVVPELETPALRAHDLDGLGIEVRSWADGEDAAVIAADALGPVGAGEGQAPVGIGDDLPARHALPLLRRLGERAGRADGAGLPAVSATTVLRDLRMIKDATEIAALREAGAAIDRVHSRMGEFLQVGRTEADIATRITAAMHEEGHTGVDFVIVGSGPHGADPHHDHSERVVERGDIVVIDIGGPIGPGYYSDCTRTYVLGEPDPAAAALIAVLERAQAAAVARARPGVTAGSVDAAARDLLAEAGLADTFIHRTGHGIGLSVHEEPYIVAGNDLELRAGMAFSIEPGIYFPGRWGARIEDIVIVTADGCEPVNRRPHGLTRLPG